MTFSPVSFISSPSKISSCPEKGLRPTFVTKNEDIGSLPAEPPRSTMCVSPTTTDLAGLESEIDELVKSNTQRLFFTGSESLRASVMPTLFKMWPDFRKALVYMSNVDSTIYIRDSLTGAIYLMTSDLTELLNTVDLLLIERVDRFNASEVQSIHRNFSAYTGDASPFGGLRIIATGDFCYSEPLQGGSYAFQAPVWIAADFQTYAVRLRDNTSLSPGHILQKIRKGEVDYDDVEELCRRSREVRYPYGILPTTLHHDKVAAAKINQMEQVKLQLRSHISSFLLIPDTESGNIIYEYSQVVMTKPKMVCMYPMPIPLTSDSGSLCKLPPMRRVNAGSRGVVIRIIGTYAIVRLVDGGCIYASPDMLRLAWALSLEDSENMKLDAVELDMLALPTAHNVYAAFTRIKNAESLRVKVIFKSGFRLPKLVLDYYNPKGTPEEGDACVFIDSDADSPIYRDSINSLKSVAETAAQYALSA